MFNIDMLIDGIGDAESIAVLEKQMAALTNVATVAAVNSPAVTESPKNTAPNKAEVQAVVNQVVSTVAPVIAPSVPPAVVTRLTPLIAETVSTTRGVISASPERPVSAPVIQQITSKVESTFRTDAQKDAQLGIARAPIISSNVDEQTQFQAKNTVSTSTQTPVVSESSKPAFTPDPQDVRDPVTGLTPAQVAAQKALNEAVAAGKALGIETKTIPATTGNVPLVSVTKVPTSTTTSSVSFSSQQAPSGVDPALLALIQSLQSQIASLSGSLTQAGGANAQAQASLIQGLQSQISALTGNLTTLTANQTQAQLDAAAAAASTRQQQTQSAIAVLTDRFTRYGLGSLVPKIRELAVGGATEATIALQLQDTEEYRQRFRANQDRIKKGLAVLEPAEYLGLEDKYRQILRAYGLRQFDNDNYVTQFISNDVSTAELSSRVELAVQRVQNADPAVLNTLTKFYGISANDLVGYALDPEKQFQKIERQVAAAEIGAAAGMQGIQPGVSVAEQLAAQGITKAEAQRGYSTIADILPTAQKLSDIYGTTLEGYGLAEAEQEVFNSLASAQRKRRKLAEREIAAFSGTSGVGRQSLASQIGGQI